MRLNFAFAGALTVLTGCQMHSSEPTKTMTVAGNYKAVADCFYLKMRGEGMWRKDDLESMNTSQVVMGTDRFAAGRIDFVGTSTDQTAVTLLIPHADKFTPKIQACASA